MVLRKRKEVEDCFNLMFSSLVASHFDLENNPFLPGSMLIITTSLRPHWESLESLATQGNHPQMALIQVTGLFLLAGRGSAKEKISGPNSGQ